MTFQENAPLNWPAGWPRTVAGNRVRSPFGQRSVAAAVDGLVRELELLRCESAVISRSAVLRGQPLDPGIAVYFRLKGCVKIALREFNDDRIENTLGGAS